MTTHREDRQRVIGSVRSQLTVAVALLVGAIGLTTALVAPKVVRESLVNDRLEAQRELESAEMADGRSEIWQRLDVTRLGTAELTALFGPEVAALTSELDAIDALDQLRAVDPDRELHVLTGPDVVAAVTSDGRVRVQASPATPNARPVVSQERLQRLAADHGVGRGFGTSLPLFVDGTLSFETFLDEMTAEFAIDLRDYLDPNVFDGFPGFDADEELIPLDVFELLRDELPGVDTPTQLAPTPATNQLAVGTRTIEGRPMLLTASLDGIDESVTRVRTLLWFGLPAAIAAAALLTWLLAGRTLRPVVDITDRTRQIRSSTLHERVPVPPAGDEITALATEMNEMLDRVEREDARRRQFVSDASHELRSPIASIRAQAEAAHADQSELATGVLAEAERMSSLVDDLLALARSDEPRSTRHRVVDLDDLVYEEASRPRRVAVDIGAVSAGQVVGAPDELTRLLTHLLDNAARHARSQVVVSLATHDDGRVVLTVDDDGDGVDPADRERIFERFVRLDDARDRDRGGAGLGLAVVDATARSIGARVRVDTASIGGARFEVTFPVAQTAGASDVS